MLRIPSGISLEHGSFINRVSTAHKPESLVWVTSTSPDSVKLRYKKRLAADLAACCNWLRKHSSTNLPMAVLPVAWATQNNCVWTGSWPGLTLSPRCNSIVDIYVHIYIYLCTYLYTHLYAYTYQSTCRYKYSATLGFFILSAASWPYCARAIACWGSVFKASIYARAAPATSFLLFFFWSISQPYCARAIACWGSVFRDSIYARAAPATSFFFFFEVSVNHIANAQKAWGEKNAGMDLGRGV